MKNLICKINKKTSILSQADKRKIVTNVVKRLFQPCKGINDSYSKPTEPLKIKNSLQNSLNIKRSPKEKVTLPEYLFSPIRLQNKNITIQTCKKESITKIDEKTEELKENVRK